MLKFSKRSKPYTYHTLLMLLGMSVSSLLLWSHYTRLPSGLLVPGNITHSEGSFPIMAANSGHIKSIYVRPGDHVQAGDIILSLDDKEAVSELQALTFEWLQLALQQKSLQYESNAYPDHVEFTDILRRPEFIHMQAKASIDNQHMLYQAQKHAFESRLQENIHSQSELQQIVAVQQAQYQLLQRRALMVQDVLNTGQRLVNDGVKSSHVQKKDMIEQNSILENLKTLEQNIISNQSKIQTLKLQEQRLHSDNRIRLQQAQQQLAMDIARQKSQVISAQQKIASLRLRSPIDGIISQQSIFYPGQWTPAGQELGFIIPKNDDYVVKLLVPEKERKDIELGMKARITLRGDYNQKFEAIEGFISYIDSQSIPSNDGQKNYTVWLRLAQNHWRSDDQPYPLHEGHAVDVLLITAEQTVLEQLLSPFFYHMKSALREK